MRYLQGIIEEKLEIKENTALYGMVNGETSVDPGKTLNLHGVINGNLLLMDKSIVNLHGTVNGDVINSGGTLKVFGMINGNLHKRGGDTTISETAMIHGEIIG